MAEVQGQLAASRQSMELPTPEHRTVMLPLPLSSHDWIRRFVEQMHRLRPESAMADMLELAVAVHAVASPFLPEQVAVLNALECVPSLHEWLCA